MPFATPGTPDCDQGDTRQSEHCMVCGEALQYHDKTGEVFCIYCRRPDSGHILCPNGHYVCEHCHNRDATRLIENLVLTTDSTSPNEMAELAFSFPGLPMLGCQHAYIAGGALMAALKNERNARLSNDDIMEVFKRTSTQAHGGYCGLSGVCGIVPAIGACISVLTGAQCGKDREQRLTMEAVTRVMKAITELTGPSCCKAYVRSALACAMDFLAEHLSIHLPSGNVTTCRFSPRHPHGCRETDCPYFDIPRT